MAAVAVSRRFPPTRRLRSNRGSIAATLPGGHTLAIMIADIATGDAKDVWHPEAGSAFANLNNITWAGDVFIWTQLAKPTDESNSYYAMSVSGQSAPVQLTTTDGIIEDATAAALSKDGKMLYYCTNTNDIDRRHIWGVPTSGGTPVQITTGDGIENVPMPLSSGKQVAVLSADAKRPMSVGIWPTTPTPSDVGQKAQKVIYPTLGAGLPDVVDRRADERDAEGRGRHGVPQPVVPAGRSSSPASSGRR